ncbi:MAG TPA: IS200/IS605 family transposase [Blastocatellia bacterium]|nr:IS200/IS605 family transposase [Blastocatellia bacterium]
MPSTHTSLRYHLVFSTKDRIPMIAQDWQAQLHAYLGGIVKDVGGVPLAVGGMADHVHLLIGLKPTHCLADVLREVKGGSSEWVHATLGRKKFAWQPGYGGYTVSPSNIERVRQYILHQQEHHRRRTFQEEYVEMLRMSGIEYDERYLW